MGSRRSIPLPKSQLNTDEEYIPLENDIYDEFFVLVRSDYWSRLHMMMFASR